MFPRGLFDSGDAGVLRKDFAGFRQDVHPGAAGDAVEDHRKLRSVGDLGEMGNQPPLGGFVVVRGYLEKRVRSQALRLPGELAGIGGVVAAGPGHHRNPLVDPLHRISNAVHVLLVGHAGRLSRSAADDDGVSSPLNLVVDELSQLLIMNASVRMHGGDDGHARPPENRLLQISSLPFNAVCMFKR